MMNRFQALTAATLAIAVGATSAKAQAPSNPPSQLSAAALALLTKALEPGGTVERCIEASAAGKRTDIYSTNRGNVWCATGFGRGADITFDVYDTKNLPKSRYVQQENGLVSVTAAPPTSEEFAVEAVNVETCQAIGDRLFCRGRKVPPAIQTRVRELTERAARIFVKSRPQ